MSDTQPDITDANMVALAAYANRFRHPDGSYDHDAAKADLAAAGLTAAVAEGDDEAARAIIAEYGDLDGLDPEQALVALKTVIAEREAVPRPQRVALQLLAWHEQSELPATDFLAGLVLAASKLALDLSIKPKEFGMMARESAKNVRRRLEQERNSRKRAVT